MTAVPVPEIIGAGHQGACYHVSDTEVAAGSTLGSPNCVCVIKATGAIEEIYSSDCGSKLMGTIVAHHWDGLTGIALTPLPGKFVFHPEHQEHFFALSNGIEVHEDIFVLSGMPKGRHIDPPGVYYTVELYNPTSECIRIETYGFAELRGDTPHDVVSRFDARRHAIVACNKSRPQLVRMFACSRAVTSWETTMDHGKAIAKDWPGVLGYEVTSPAADPLGVLHLRHKLEPGARASFCFTMTFSSAGQRSAAANLDKLPTPRAALHRTRSHYANILNRSVVLTPDAYVNRGVLWAKANMLRTQLLAPTGWCFVNDPARSNNSVARDTAWFAFGSDYVTPEFSQASLLWYAEHLERKGMCVEYYDIRTGKTADYKLNINDNTPLLILALWHHYSTTGKKAFLEKVYPPAAKAANYILSQRNKQGLVWCTATGVADWGIVGWRNVIADYRLSGATTELNSECYAALLTVSHMARLLGHHEQSAHFKDEAHALRAAINTHLLDRQRGLYYLNIDLDGHPRSDVTSDLVFPVMFGVADDDTAAGIISRLSSEEFWTEAGIRTVPRNASNYGPTHGYGLLGGVWVGVAFWFAFAAARFNPEFMAYALAQSFQHYSKDPRRNNTVPGQFSEWLHGETLANRGMMLSPWFPPRYLWAAIEGAAGLNLSGATPSITPRLSPDWKWLGVRDVPFCGRNLTWFVVRAPELQMFTNYDFQQSSPFVAYEKDITNRLDVSSDAVVSIALRQDQNVVLFVGNTTERTVTAAVSIKDQLRGSFAVRIFNSLRAAWVDGDAITAGDLERGVPVQVERKGFCLFELRQEV
ncbi:MAG: amylo-alpha-1,6-glucosidase [Candidatus Baltobacteraceae bacterium]